MPLEVICIYGLGEILGTVVRESMAILLYG